MFSASGKSEGDGFGFAFAISGDGMTLAVGAGSESGFQGGYMKLYKKSGTDWSEFQEISGDADGSQFGGRIDLSNDGSILITSDRIVTEVDLIDIETYELYIYELSSGASQYALLDTMNNSGTFAVSGDGSVVGVSDFGIYERGDDGFDLKGLAFSDSWDSISLNGDGSIVILGDYGWNSERGRARVLQWKEKDGSMDWIQMGDVIEGDEDFNSGDRETVAISSDGLTVSIGSARASGEKGVVRVYTYDGTEETWNQRGGDLIGDNALDSLAKNEVSSGVTYLVAGAFAGNFKIFQWNGSDYEVRERVSSEDTSGGKLVDISADGSLVVYANPRMDTGTIYLYETGAPVDDQQKYIFN